MNNREVQALIKLLDDDDNFVVETVEGRLLDIYDGLTPFDLKLLYNSAKGKAKSRFENIARRKSGIYFEERIKDWFIRPSDPVEPLFLISRLFEPFIDEDYFFNFFDSINELIPDNFLHNFSPLEQANIITGIFFGDRHIRTNMRPPIYKSYIPSNVIKYKQGSPLTIATMIVVVANRLGLEWILNFDLPYRQVLIAIPSGKDSDFFFIDPRFGSIISDVPEDFDAKEMNNPQNIMEQVPDKTVYNIIPLLTVFLQENFLPRHMDSQWYAIKRVVDFLQKLYK